MPSPFTRATSSQPADDPEAILPRGVAAAVWRAATHIAIVRAASQLYIWWRAATLHLAPSRPSLLPELPRPLARPGNASPQATYTSIQAQLREVRSTGRTPKTGLLQTPTNGTINFCCRQGTTSSSLRHYLSLSLLYTAAPDLHDSLMSTNGWGGSSPEVAALGRLLPVPVASRHYLGPREPLTSLHCTTGINTASEEVQCREGEGDLNRLYRGELQSGGMHVRYQVPGSAACNPSTWRPDFPPSEFDAV